MQELQHILYVVPRFEGRTKKLVSGPLTLGLDYVITHTVPNSAE